MKTTEIQLYSDIGTGAHQMDPVAQTAVMQILFEGLYGNNTLVALNSLVEHWEIRWEQAMRHATDDELDVKQTVTMLWHVRMKTAEILIAKYKSEKARIENKINSLL